MKNFGLLKTKIEDILTEAYQNRTFKKEIKKFQTLVLENKDFSQIYHIYQNLTNPQGFSEEVSKEFLEEGIKMIRDLSKTVNTKEIDGWVKNQKSKNRYEYIDSIVGGTALNIAEVVTIKKTIIEGLQKTKEEKQIINLPLKTMLSIANKAVGDLISEMDVDSQNELKSIMNLSDDEIKTQHADLKETILTKLQTNLNEQLDVDLVKTIHDTIERIKSDKPTNLHLYKLRKLNESL